MVLLFLPVKPAKLLFLEPTAVKYATVITMDLVTTWMKRVPTKFVNRAGEVHRVV